MDQRREEDNIKSLEDDLKFMEDDLKKEDDPPTPGSMKDTVKNLHTTRESVETPGASLSGTYSAPPTVTPGPVVEVIKESLAPKHVSTTVAGDNTRVELDNPQQDIKTTEGDGPFAESYQKIKTGSITVNGVKLEEILKRKRCQEGKTVRNNDVKKTPGRKNTKKTTPSSGGKVNTMKRYVVKTNGAVRKQEDNIPSEDNLIHEDKAERQEPASLSPRQQHGVDTHISVDKTLTFETTHVRKTNAIMSDKISRFQELVERSQVCVT